MNKVPSTPVVSLETAQSALKELKSQRQRCRHLEHQLDLIREDKRRHLAAIEADRTQILEMLIRLDLQLDSPVRSVDSGGAPEWMASLEVPSEDPNEGMDEIRGENLGVVLDEGCTNGSIGSHARDSEYPTKGSYDNLCPSLASSEKHTPENETDPAQKQSGDGTDSPLNPTAASPSSQSMLGNPSKEVNHPEKSSAVSVALLRENQSIEVETAADSIAQEPSPLEELVSVVPLPFPEALPSPVSPVSESPVSLPSSISTPDQTGLGQLTDSNRESMRKQQIVLEPDSDNRPDKRSENHPNHPGTDSELQCINTKRYLPKPKPKRKLTATRVIQDLHLYTHVCPLCGRVLKRLPGLKVHLAAHRRRGEMVL